MTNRTAAPGARSEHVVAYSDASTVAGAERVLATTIAHLPADLQVTIAGPSAEVVEWIASHRPGCQVAAMPPFAGRRDLHRGWKLWRALRRLSPTTIHLNKNEVAGLRYVEVLCQLARIPVVSVVHSPRPPSTRIARWLCRRLASRAAATVTVSRAGSSQLAAMLDLDPTEVTTIPNAVEPLSLSVEDHDGFTIGVVARLVPHKCVDLVLDAVAAVPDVAVLIGGDGPARRPLEMRAERLGLADRVEFLGWADPGDVLGRSDAVALVSEVEGQPLSLLDARAAGLPVIATDVGGVSEIVVDGETGMLVPIDDVDALVSAIQALATDHELAVRMGRAARQHHAESGGPAAMATAYRRLYARAGARSLSSA